MHFHDTMSGLEALGAASSVLQVISFGLEMTRLCKAIYDGATGDDSKIQENVAAMSTASARMLKYTGSLSMKDKEGIELKNILIKCNRVVKELKLEADRIHRSNAKGSLVRTVGAATKYRWKRDTLRNLETELHEHKTTMQLQIVIRLL